MLLISNRLSLFLIAICVSVILHAQSVQVHAGAELIFHGNTDLSSHTAVKWISERGNMPGFFSILSDEKFANFSDRLHINGHIKKYGNTAFVFPVGNGSELRILEISKPDQLSDAYATAWIEGNPGDVQDPTLPHAGLHPVNKVQEPIQSVSTIGQWDWLVGEGGNLGDQTTGNGYGIRITATIPDLSKFAGKSELRLVGWNGKNWIDLSGRPSATGNGKNSKITGTMVPGITAIAVGKIKPVVVGLFEYIEAQAVNCKTQLQWKTSFELDSTHMVIERSIDGASFQAILRTDAKGSPTGNIYSAWVTQPHGKAFYRVRMENKDGYTSLSPISYSQMNCPALNSMVIFPNPVYQQTDIQVRVNTHYNGPAVLVIYSLNGRKVITARVSTQKGMNVFSVPVTEIFAGYYIVELKDLAGEPLAASTQLIKQ